MKVSVEWLNDCLESPADARELESRLTGLGLAVDGVERPGDGLADVVVGRVERVERHPNADRLTLCRVFDGTDTKQVVCGAPNVAAGRHYPFARVGVSLPVGITLKKAKIRGEVSEGMLCSAEELGLGEDSSGILDLGDEVTPGAGLVETMGLTDTVFDLDITYNRPDWMSVRGVAREVGAALGTALRKPNELTGEIEPRAADAVAVSIEDPVDCPVYGARVVRGAKVGPSPDWLRARLESIGQRSISNIVDVTNYVLHTFGQPIHAFDLAKVRGGEIGVRRARAGETLVLLDGTEKTFNDEVLLIVDGEGPTAVAGIMGGAHSEVDEATTDVLIESAYFEGARVRAGVKAIGLETEAAIRFSRGVDADTVLLALDETARLIREVAGGVVSEGRVVAGEVPRPAEVVELRSSRIERVLGKSIDRDEVDTTLDRLGFSPEWTPDGSIVRATAPTWRRDVHLEEDLIEDIARFHGFDQFEARDYNPSARSAVPNPTDRAIGSSMGFFVGAGYREVFTTSFQPGDEAKRTASWGWMTGTPIALLNAKSQEFSMMRTSLWPGLIRVAVHNVNHDHDAFSLVEHGKVYARPEGSTDPRETERIELAGVHRGPSSPADWSRPAVEFGVFDLKGLIEAWCRRMRLPAPIVEGGEHEALDPASAFRFVAGKVQGIGGLLSKSTAKAYDVPQDLWMFSIDFEGALEVDTVYPRHVDDSKFPAVKRDLAFVLPRTATNREVEALIRNAGGPLVWSVRLFDVYEGEAIGADRKSFAYALQFRSRERSLTGTEVDDAVQEIVDRLQRKLDAVLRDG